MAKLNTVARQQIGSAVRKIGNRREDAAYSDQSGAQVPESPNGPFIGIAQEDIVPNSPGEFKFGEGTKGSETAVGDAYSGYFRTSEDSPLIKSGDVVIVTWIGGGWEIYPAIDTVRNVRIVITQQTIGTNASGNCKFAQGAKGSETAVGDNVSMYWRTTGTKPIPSGTKCYATWVGDGGVNGGWELDPVGCL